MDNSGFTWTQVFDYWNYYIPWLISPWNTIKKCPYTSCNAHKNVMVIPGKWIISLWYLSSCSRTWSNWRGTNVKCIKVSDVVDFFLDICHTGGESPQWMKVLKKVSNIMKNYCDQTWTLQLHLESHMLNLALVELDPSNLPYLLFLVCPSSKLSRQNLVFRLFLEIFFMNSMCVKLFS